MYVQYTVENIHLQLLWRLKKINKLNFVININNAFEFLFILEQFLLLSFQTSLLQFVHVALLYLHHRILTLHVNSILIPPLGYITYTFKVFTKLY